MRVKDLGVRKSFRLVGDPTNTTLYLSPVKDGRGCEVLDARTHQAVSLTGNELVTSVMGHDVDYDRL